MFARRIVARSVITVSKRNAGWLKKNIRVEENAGIKEVGYTTWEFGFKEFWSLSKLFFIPTAVLYVLLVRGWTDRDVAVGQNRKYGILPPWEVWGHEGFYDKDGKVWKSEVRKQ